MLNSVKRFVFKSLLSVSSRLAYASEIYNSDSFKRIRKTYDTSVFTREDLSEYDSKVLSGTQVVYDLNNIVLENTNDFILRVETLKGGTAEYTRLSRYPGCEISDKNYISPCGMFFVELLMSETEPNKVRGIICTQREISVKRG